MTIATQSPVFYIPRSLNHILSFLFIWPVWTSNFSSGNNVPGEKERASQLASTGGLWRPHLCCNNRNTPFPILTKCKADYNHDQECSSQPIYHLLAWWEWTVNVLQANPKRIRQGVSQSFARELFQPCCTPFGYNSETLTHAMKCSLWWQLVTLICEEAVPTNGYFIGLRW